MEQMNNQRRNFLKLASAATAGAVVLITMSPRQSMAAGPVVKSKISANHGHSFSISLADLENNGATTYSIQGSSGHPHEIEMTDADIQKLLDGKTVVTESSDVAGHTHTVTLTVA